LSKIMATATGTACSSNLGLPRKNLVTVKECAKQSAELGKSSENPVRELLVRNRVADYSCSGNTAARRIRSSQYRPDN
jgi:hypothetical protein